MKKALLALLLLLGLHLAVGAQGPLSPSFEESQALADIEEHKYIHLRELAQKMLEKPETKDRYTTYFFMGYVLHHAEGDLPRSRWYLEKAAEKFEQQHGKAPSASAPWGWYSKILMELVQVLAEMDQYEEQIKTLNRFDDLLRHEFGRPIPLIQAFYSWPLMKLGREKEAREALQRASADPDENSRVQVLNSLGALEMETDHPAASYRAFQTLIEEVRSNGWRMSCTYLRNGGEAAACLLRYDEAERLFLEATEYFEPESYSNPWWDLATMYLSQARFPEAVSALKRCHRWTFDSEPYLAQQSWAANQQLTCEILLQLGMTEHALKIARSFVERPDRKGGDSVQLDQWEAANMIIYREAAMARRTALREAMVWTRGKAWWKLLWEQQQLGWDAYLRGQQAASLMVSHGRILSALRYAYAPGTVLIPNYVRLELATLLGPGPTLAALDQLEAKKYENLELEKPYLDAMRFEALARAGRGTEALGMLEVILQKMPSAEQLLRARLLARAAKIHRQLGQMDKALPLLQQVMEKSPGFLRSLEIGLPTSFASDGSPVANQVVGMCRRSPRFDEAEGAFRVEVTASNARLLGPDGSVLAQAELGQLEKGEEPAPKLCEELHDRFFAAPIDLSQLDVNSLDGVVTGGVQSKQMQEMFFPGSTRSQDDGGN